MRLNLAITGVYLPVSPHEARRRAQADITRWIAGPDRILSIAGRFPLADTGRRPRGRRGRRQGRDGRGGAPGMTRIRPGAGGGPGGGRACRGPEFRRGRADGEGADLPRHAAVCVRQRDRGPQWALDGHQLLCSLGSARRGPGGAALDRPALDRRHAGPTGPSTGASTADCPALQERLHLLEATPSPTPDVPGLNDPSDLVVTPTASATAMDARRLGRRRHRRGRGEQQRRLAIGALDRGRRQSAGGLLAKRRAARAAALVARPPSA